MHCGSRCVSCGRSLVLMVIVLVRCETPSKIFQIRALELPILSLDMVSDNTHPPLQDAPSPSVLCQNDHKITIASSLSLSLDPLSQPFCLPRRPPLTSGTHRLDRVVLRVFFLFVAGRAPTRRGSRMLSRRAAPRIGQLHARAFSMSIRFGYSLVINSNLLTKNSHGLKSRPRFVAPFEIELNDHEIK